jgi:hypothetical protein
MYGYSVLGQQFEKPPLGMTREAFEALKQRQAWQKAEDARRTERLRERRRAARKAGYRPSRYA